MNPFQQGVDPQEIERRAMLSQLRNRPVDAARDMQQPNPVGGPSTSIPAMPGASAVADAPYAPKGKALGLEGFDFAKMARGHVSPKYVFAKHAQGLGVDDRDELLRRLQSDESGYFKNARFGGSRGDKLMVDGELDPKFEGYNTFDVIRAMGEGGKGWQWGAEGGPGVKAKPRQPSVQDAAASLDATGMSQGSAVPALTEDSTWRKLLARMNQINGPEATDRNALMSLLTK